MHLRNFLIVVRDIEKSKAFYHDIFGLDVIADFDGNVILTEGLVLQEKSIWEQFIQCKVTGKGNDTELYFEENDMDAFLTRLEESSYPIEYINPLMEHDWGQRVIRIYDPDGHMIEVGEAMDFVARRYLSQGMIPEEVARKTQLPLSQVQMLVDSKDV